MKRIALLTVFFYACTFAAPQRSYAVVPIAVIGAAAVGAAMMSSSVGAYYAQNGELPQYVKAAAGAVASANDYLYQKGYLAIGPLTLTTAASFPAAASVYLGKQNAIGAKLGDIVNAAKNAVDGAYLDFVSLVASNTTSTGVDPANIGVGEIVALASGNYLISSFANTSVSAVSTVNAVTDYVPITGGGKIFYSGGNIVVCKNEFYNGITTLYKTYLYYTSKTTSPATILPGSSINYPALAGALSPTVPASVADDVRNIIKSLPTSQVTTAASVPTTADLAQASSTLTQAEINDYLKQNTAEVAQAAADAAAQIAAANPTDAAAQIAANQAALEAARAAQEAAEQPDEETFSPISDSPFGLAYSPGPYDIPTRFTTFLANVKTSGLFSFSSAFFESLPGGGTSTYTVDAGIYGTHTIDLSDTMSGGLAVLKTILLVVFGFLSIRAVIMKR